MVSEKRKEHRKTVTLYFNTQNSREKELWEFLEDKFNKNAFIKELIWNDINGISIIKDVMPKVETVIKEDPEEDDSIDEIELGGVEL